MPSSGPGHRSLEEALSRLYRQEYGRLVAALVQRFGDLDLAEDVAQDALAAAWERWISGGQPDKPVAWLTTVARNRALDRIRGQASAARALRRLRSEFDGYTAPAADHTLTEATGLPDDRLAMLMGCCHPGLAPADRIALMLRFVAGLSSAEVATALLVPPGTMQARITRAKKRIRRSGIPLLVPEDPAERRRRLPLVLQAISVLFTEGYAATSGAHPLRSDLTAEAIRLARLLHRLMPTDPEPAGLLGLLLLTQARAPARVDPQGLPVPLEDQDRALWDAGLIGEGRGLVERAARMAGAGRWTIQAAIAACHAEAPSFAQTDWDQVVALYDLLRQHDPGPVVRMNQAIAIGRRDGLIRGLALLDRLAEEPLLQSHQPFHTARALTLAELGDNDGARVAYLRALELTTNEGERRLLKQRLAGLN